jgi:thiamine-phosphate pyrophosphorylase
VNARVVVVTDRRLCAAPEIAGRIAAIVRAVPRGSVMFQVREKDLDGGPLLALVGEVMAVARPAGADVWVNDRLDVALAAGADGVHLPENGLAIEDARAIVGATGRVLAIGCSRHTPESAIAAAAAGAALVQLGPIWPTPGKGQPIGPGALKIALPKRARLVAIGGIDGPARAGDAALAGAHAIAVIRAAWTASDPGTAVAALVEAMDRSRPS